MAADSPRELFLIDGNSLVYRAFFALPESIATSKGQPTNAIFGFASMLVKIISEYGVKPTLVVWDAGMSGREQIYGEYKGHRDERPGLLSEQWPYMHPLVDSFGYENVKVAGYEADDVIATLAGQARGEGIDVMVVTGDRDLFQLIEPGVRIMATGRGITDTKIYDREAVLDRYGIPPELIPDFVGLKGDTSDNIPGVPGIGDKTASQLLQEWGDLEGVLSNIESVSGAKRKQNLTEHAENARISKQLATAVRDVDVEVDFAQVIAREPDRSRLRETFREFELRAPLERLEEALGEDDAAPAERVDEVVEVAARKVPLAEIGSLDGELVAIAALRPGEDPDEAVAPAPADELEEELAAEEDAAAEAVEQPRDFRLLYPDEATLRHKIETVGTKVYGAGSVDYSTGAARGLEAYERMGLGRLPVCIAKTHLSISSDPSLKGAPTGWTLPVREARAAAGAGFVYLISGDMRTMPGLSSHPAAESIDIDENGEVVGLY